MYEFLEKLFGKGENGEPKAMTFAELQAAIDADKSIKLVNLKDGGYVAQEKFDAQETKLKAVEQQLTDANTQIKSFEGEDIDGIKKKVSDWETKYAADTEALRKQMEEQETRHQRDMYFGGVKFASNAARNGVIMEFDKQGFQLKDGVFQGADDWLTKYKAADPSAFVQEDTKTGADGTGSAGTGDANGTSGAAGATGAVSNGQQYFPNFATKTSNGSGTGMDQKKSFGYNFAGVRKRPEQQ